MDTFIDLQVDYGRTLTVLTRLKRMEGLKLGLAAAMLYFKGRADDYPPRKQISRKQAYGVTFFSDVQRRAFFAKLNSGEITVPGVRRGSGGLAGKWFIHELRDGLVQELGNTAPYKGHVLGPRQARMMTMIGWRTMRNVYDAEKTVLQRIVTEQIVRSIWA